MSTKKPEALAQECADYATSLRSTINVVKLEGRTAPISFLRAAELFERAAARIAELEALAAGYAAARLEIESLQKAGADRHALQATGTHPAPCARYCEAVAFNIEQRRLERLVEDQRLEIASLQASYIELEPLCEATYIAQGADAYFHACEEMERHQALRSKAGKEVGTTQSLCDGMSWLYRHIAALEAQLEAVCIVLRSKPIQPPRDALLVTLDSAVAAIPAGWAGSWRWMRHPDWNDGEPLPVQTWMEASTGVVYYRPFDAGAAEFEWAERDAAEWEEIPLSPQPAAQALDAQPFLRDEDLERLHRFIETIEDDESYDIGKDEVKRLAELGVVSNHGFGRYGVTAFGYWAHERDWEQNPSLPLKTNSDRDAEHRAAIAAKQGVK